MCLFFLALHWRARNYHSICESVSLAYAILVCASGRFGEQIIRIEEADTVIAIFIAKLLGLSPRLLSLDSRWQLLVIECPEEQARGLSKGRGGWSRSRSHNEKHHQCRASYSLKMLIATKAS